ncbi:DUF2567 domain-containing protein [Nocardia sp. CA-119907]|uniref:DUF2567 domain-containing protein n=1 Tax=Nocardia sp. CA-119907 TaxID=3239973 RepID=UPI003D990F5C
MAEYGDIQIAPPRSARRLGVRRELRAAALIAVGALLLSALGGVVWAFVAPTQQYLVVKARAGAVPAKGASLTGESVHQFDALAIFVCIGAVLGVLTAVGAWRWRRARGPLLQIGLLIGAVAGAYVMSKVGEQIMRWQHPMPYDPPVGQIVRLPVEVGSWLALIVQPLLASLIVLFLAALSPSEDLGTGSSGPFGNRRRSSFAASTFESVNGADPYRGAANGGPMPYGVPYNGFGPPGEAGSGRAR